MRPSGVRHASFPPYICHIYIPQFLPAKLSGLRCLAHSPYFGMPDAVRIPQTGGLPSPSFRFHLTMDTLGVRLVVGVGRLRPHSGLSPPRYVLCPAHENGPGESGTFLFCNNSYLMLSAIVLPASLPNVKLSPRPEPSTRNVPWKPPVTSPAA